MNFSLSDSTLNVKSSGTPVNVDIGRHQTRVSLSVELNSDAYASSHSAFEPEAFAWGICVKTTLPSINKYKKLKRDAG